MWSKDPISYDDLENHWHQGKEHSIDENGNNFPAETIADLLEHVANHDTHPRLYNLVYIAGMMIDKQHDEVKEAITPTTLAYCAAVFTAPDGLAEVQDVFTDYDAVTQSVEAVNNGLLSHL